MSQLSDIGNLANLTTAMLEDQFSIPHPFQGCVNFGPIKLNNDRDTNRFIFGVEIDKRFREAGWTLVTKNAATGSIGSVLFPDGTEIIDAHSGLPSYPNDAPLFEMLWIVDNSGDFIQGFNPHRVGEGFLKYGNGIPPPSFPWEVGGTWFAESDDPDSNWQGLADTLYGLNTSNPADTFPRSAIFPAGDRNGSFANERTFTGNGFFTVAGNSQGAGKTFESVEHNGMKLRVHVGLGGMNGNFAGNLGLLITVLRNVGEWVPVGQPYLITMMTQDDYLFFIDPYSFYMVSRARTFHADLYQDARVFATVINSLVAMPQHTSLTPIPPTALVTNTLWELLSHDEGNWYFDETAFEGQSLATNTDGGWFVETMRSGPFSVVNNDDSDVMFPTKLLFSVDFSGSGGTLGPTQYLGQGWNMLTMQRTYGTPLQEYWVDAPRPAVGDEVTLPKFYRVFLTQTGGETTYAFKGSAGSVLLAMADYQTMDALYNLPPTDPDDAPVKIELISEYNLFAKPTVTDESRVLFRASGGKAVNSDHSDSDAHFQPPKYVWTAIVPLIGWSSNGSGGSTNEFLTLSGPSRMSMIGRHALTVQATDTFGNTRTLQYYLVIGTPSYPQILESGLPDGSVGVAYDAPVVAYGGSGDFDGWAVVSGGLPPGLSIGRTDPVTGSIAGFPSLTGIYDFTVLVADATTGEVTMPQTFRITVS